MKSTTVFALLAASLLFAAASWAHDSRKDKHDRRGSAHDGAIATEVVEHLHRALRHLDLSAGQKEDIRGEFKQLKEDTKPLRHELHQGRMLLHELLMADVYDADAVSELADEQGELAAQMIRLASGAASGSDTRDCRP